MSTQLSLKSDLTKWDDKFDRIVKWYNDDTGKLTLPKPLEEQLARWTFIYGLLNLPKHRYKRDTALLKAIMQNYPDLCERTARTALKDTRRFFGIIDSSDLAFERVMLIGNMKDTMHKARVRNDLKSLTSAERNYMQIIGADKPQEQVENKTVINVINYNPTQIAGDLVLSEEQIDELIEKMLASDKKKQDNPFDDFEDVSAQPAE